MTKKQHKSFVYSQPRKKSYGKQLEKLNSGRTNSWLKLESINTYRVASIDKKIDPKGTEKKIFCQSIINDKS